MYKELMQLQSTALTYNHVDVWFDDRTQDGTLMSQVIDFLVPIVKASIMEPDKVGPMGVSRNDVASYINGLIFTRVKFVRRELSTTLRPVMDFNLVIPVPVMLMLKQIGVAEDVDLGVTFLPQTEIDEPDPLFLQKMSQILRSAFRANHVEYGEEIPRTRYGSYDFMSVNVISNAVCPVNPGTPPNVALLAAIMQNRIDNDIFSPRVSYGSTEAFSYYIGDAFFGGELFPNDEISEKAKAKNLRSAKLQDDDRPFGAPAQKTSKGKRKTTFDDRTSNEAQSR